MFCCYWVFCQEARGRNNLYAALFSLKNSSDSQFRMLGNKASKVDSSMLNETTYGIKIGLVPI